MKGSIVCHEVVPAVVACTPLKLKDGEDSILKSDTMKLHSTRVYLTSMCVYNFNAS